MSTQSCYHIPNSYKLIYLVTTNSPKKLREIYNQGRLSNPSSTVWHPENDLNGVEMQQYVSEVLPGQVIITGSLYLYREFAMSKRNVLYIDLTFHPEKEHPLVTSSMDPHTFDIEIMAREIERSARFLEHQSK